MHPRDVDAHFSHGTVTNYWGGSSNATTHLLDAMHYKGQLRVARREAGIRIYAPREPGAGAGGTGRTARAPGRARRRRRPHVRAAAGRQPVGRGPAPPLRGAAVARRVAVGARARTPAARHARVDGVEWYWPADEAVSSEPAGDVVRLLAPFDPVVWDRRRFELLWGWAYRFEAYTPT